MTIPRGFIWIFLVLASWALVGGSIHFAVELARIVF